MWDVIFCTSVIYVLYLTFGAFMFMFLDNDGFEMEGFYNITNSNFSRMESILLEKNFTNDQISEIITTWKADKSFSYFRDEWVVNSPPWWFLNALVFAFHLCSTIGYGNLAPNTAYGQLLSVLYGIFGVPINILFFKVLGSSYSDAYEEIIWRIQGGVMDVRKRLLADLVFFLTWIFLLVVMPAAIFMYTENWNFLDGAYYSFITLTTVGLGDFVAGENIEKGTYYILYQVALFYWMIHGLAFVSMLADSLARVFNRFCLFSLDCNWRRGEFKIYRVIVDIERLDLHFRLLKSKGVKHKVEIWSSEHKSEKVKVFHQNHLKNLVAVAEHLKVHLAMEIQEKGGGVLDQFPVKIHATEVMGRGLRTE